MSFMAEMNLLKAFFNGKLGEAYGVRQHRKHFAKAIPFSHTPHNDKQKAAFAAFCLLNKFCSAQWQALKGTIRFTNSQILPQNVLCKDFKNMIQGAFFNLENIYSVCDKLQTVTISQATFSESEKLFTLKYTLENDSIEGIPQETALTCFDQEIYCCLSTMAQYGEQTLQFYTDREEILDPYFCFTTYRKRKKGWKVLGALAVKIDILP